MGISKAASLLANPDASTRLAAWNGVQQVSPIFSFFSTLKPMHLLTLYDVQADTSYHFLLLSRLEVSDNSVCEPSIRAQLGTTAH